MPPANLDEGSRHSPAMTIDALDEKIRARARVHATPIDKWRVRVAHTAADLLSAFSLVQRAYAERGIAIDAARMRITPQHLLRESVVLVAHDGGRAIGTITVTRDSPAGLPLDHDFPECLADLRRRGAKICEFGSFAVDRDARGSGPAILLNMVAHYLARNAVRASHCVIGVHPSVEGFYRANYDFRRIAEPKAHAELDAPVLGMMHEVMAVGEFLREHFPTPMATGKLFWEHCCSALPPCVDVPAAVLAGDFSLPRAVFREVFVHRSRMLQSLDEVTRRHLDSQRGPDTVRPPSDDSAAIVLGDAAHAG